jgi:hypothetical protein
MKGLPAVAAVGSASGPLHPLAGPEMSPIGDKVPAVQSPCGPLQPDERASLAAHEAVIERGLKTFVEVGNALLAIRDGRLYREGWGTFEEYCRERWAISRIHAHRMIAAAGVAEALLPMGNIQPGNERQARPLVGYVAELQRELWQRAIDTAPEGRLTTGHVQAVVDEYRAWHVQHELQACFTQMSAFLPGMRPCERDVALIVRLRDLAADLERTFAEQVLRWERAIGKLLADGTVTPPWPMPDCRPHLRRARELLREVAARAEGGPDGD